MGVGEGCRGSGQGSRVGLGRSGDDHNGVRVEDIDRSAVRRLMELGWPSSGFRGLALNTSMLVHSCGFWHLTVPDSKGGSWINLARIASRTIIAILPIPATHAPPGIAGEVYAMSFFFTCSHLGSHGIL